MSKLGIVFVNPIQHTVGVEREMHAMLAPLCSSFCDIVLTCHCRVHHSDMATGDIVQTDAGIYKVDCTNGDNALIPDDSSVPFQEV